MVITSTILTLSLSIAIGLYFLASGFFMLTHGDRVQAMLDELRSRPALAFIAGVFTYALGTALILTHNIWTDLLAGFVSLVGWIAAIEGLVLIAFPTVLLDLSISATRPSASKPIGIVVAILGLVLVGLGIIGRAG